jgi:hypothetical protein
MAFLTEQTLMWHTIRTSYFRELRAMSPKTRVVYEPRGAFCIPDIMLVIPRDEEPEARRDSLLIYAFELKLRNWKRALRQAYRYRTFAQHSYVVMDADRVEPALQQLRLFRRSNIGLIAVGRGSGTVIVESRLRRPFSRLYRTIMERTQTRCRSL